MANTNEFYESDNGEVICAPVSQHATGEEFVKAAGEFLKSDNVVIDAGFTKTTIKVNDATDSWRNGDDIDFEGEPVEVYMTGVIYNE